MNGLVANVGLSGTTLGIEDIKIPPVSVCHQVSTIGHLSFPTCILYHCQASSFIGSPTVPKTFNDERLLFSKNLTPCLAKALMAVGAV